MADGLAIISGTHRFPNVLTERARRRTLHGPRDGVECLDLDGVILVNRHGLDGRTPVHLVDHAANVTAVALECDRVLAVGSCGSLRPDLVPGTVVAIDDVFAPWSTPTLFDDARAESLPGFDLAWRSAVLDAWRTATDVPIVDGGTYVHSPGPRFETPAEVRFYASVGDVVGMTLGAELVLAREAGLAYAAVVVVDNLANGLGDAALTVEEFETAAASHGDDLWLAIRATAAALGHHL